MSEMPEAPNNRDKFIQEHLPMHENSWSGSTLAFHVLNVTKEHAEDPNFKATLEDAFTGTQAAMFRLDDDLTEEPSLCVAELAVEDDHIVVKYEGSDDEHVIFPPGTGYDEASILHRFTITTGREHEWAEIQL